MEAALRFLPGREAMADMPGCSLDMIIIYNSGRFRMAGHGSLAGLLPYGNANGS